MLVPIVEDRDIAFWDDKKRQILKIHGCVTRPYTLVATKDDYEACIHRNSLIFNKLRDLMASKTFIFVGYSTSDSDFQIILDEIIKSLGKLRRLAYIFDPNATEEKIKSWQSKGFCVVKAYGLALLNEVRKKLQEDGYIPSEDDISYLSNEQDRIIDIHVNLNQGESGGAVASAMYQDGLIHMLSTVLSGAALGSSREYFEKNLFETERNSKKYSKAGNLVEMAYWGGQFEVIKGIAIRLKLKYQLTFTQTNLFHHTNISKDANQALSPDAEKIAVFRKGMAVIGES